MWTPYDGAGPQAAIDKLISEQKLITDNDTIRRIEGILCEGTHLARFIEGPDLLDLPEGESFYDSLEVADIYLLRASDTTTVWSVLISVGSGQSEDVVGGAAPFFELGELTKYLENISTDWAAWDFLKETASSEVDQLYEELLRRIGDRQESFI